MTFYLSQMNFNEREGRKFSSQAIKVAQEISGQYQTPLQRAVLEGDMEAIYTQAQIELSKRPNESLEENNKSVLHYAVMRRSTDMVLMLIKESQKAGVPIDINKNEIITGFTLLHYSVFVESRQILTMLLMEYDADIDLSDEFSATPLDYARMLGMVPRIPSHLVPASIMVYDRFRERLEPWSIKQFEEKLNITFCALPICGHEYIEELMFSGFSVGEKDLDFRRKYEAEMQQSTGEETLILAEIEESVGYGVFAGRNYQPGSFICRYGGYLKLEGDVKNRAYAVVSGVEGIILDATSYRNLGGMINHSARHPNAELQCFFDHGAEQAIITATKFIPKGKQILLDYSESYWQIETGEQDIGRTNKAGLIVEMGDDGESNSNPFLTQIPPAFLAQNPIC